MNIRWWQGGLFLDPEIGSENYHEDLRLLHHVFTFLVDIGSGRTKVTIPPSYHRDRDPSKHPAGPNST